MKGIRIVAGALVAYVGIVVAFESFIGFFQPQNEETIVITTTGADGKALDRVVSATAPLSAELARELETRWQTRVLEIYGCTEAGVMAYRRTTQSEAWRTFAGCTMAMVDGMAEYRAPHLPAAVSLPDMLEMRSASEFLLRGRSADMIKVAGKRASLQDLTPEWLRNRI